MPAAQIKKLTPKMIKTCEAYLRGKSMKAAMAEAGYSEKYCEDNAHVMLFLKNRHITEYIRKRQAEHAEVANIDSQYILKKLQDIIVDSDPRDRSKAVELLMRMTQPMPDAANLKAADIKSISINIETATNEQPKNSNT